MEKNKLIRYKENIFTKILKSIKNLILNKKECEKQDIKQINTSDKTKKEYFIKNIEIKEIEEEKRLKKLQFQYENDQIDEEDISNEDIDKLIQMYEKQTKELNLDTERRKKHIAQMLKELKNS